MTRALARTHFHSSDLIRCLAELAIVETLESGNAFAEKLGQWIHFADAISLSAVHSSGMANLPSTQPAAHAVPQHAARVEFDRIQTMLVNSIRKSCSPNAGKSHLALPAPNLDLPLDLAAAYAPYRRFYEAHQRDMELSIQPMRFNLRDALAKTSPSFRRLAELDAMLEKILRERESKLLAKVPVLFKKRFEQLFKEHQQKLIDRSQFLHTQQADNPAGWTQPGGWLARFCNDLQMLLLAELTLRLQPAMGLIEAFKPDTQ